MRQNKARTQERERGAARLAQLGLFLALAVILGYVEAVLPLPLGIPGVKLGLANCAIVFLLYRYGLREALAVSLLRTVLIAFLFTNLAALLYSLCGALLSLLVMAGGKRIRKRRSPDAPVFSIYGVSAAGGAAHNTAQLIVAYLVLGTRQVLEEWLTLYLPLLLLAGLAAGLVNALIAGLLLARLGQTREREQGCTRI